jgi:hypothetical protein
MGSSAGMQFAEYKIGSPGEERVHFSTLCPNADAACAPV